MARASDRRELTSTSGRIHRSSSLVHGASRGAEAEIFWRFKSGAINEPHSIAEQATYDMPANASGRMYFYVCRKDDATCKDPEYMLIATGW